MCPSAWDRWASSPGSPERFLAVAPPFARRDVNEDEFCIFVCFESQGLLGIDPGLPVFINLMAVDGQLSPCSVYEDSAPFGGFERERSTSVQARPVNGGVGVERDGVTEGLTGSHWEEPVFPVRWIVCSLIIGRGESGFVRIAG